MTSFGAGTGHLPPARRSARGRDRQARAARRASPGRHPGREQRGRRAHSYARCSPRCASGSSAGAHGLVMLDNSAKLFAVREGDRIGVTRCVGLLNAICEDFDTTAVLVAHDNKSGDYSGSTAWENCCRSRLHLTRDDDDGAIIMAMPKANYSATGASSCAGMTGRSAPTIPPA